MTRVIPLAHPLDDSGLPHRQSAPAVPQQQEATPAVLADLARYHHPHFVRVEPGATEDWAKYYFREFTGLEALPEAPIEAYRDASVTWEQRRALAEQYQAAEIVWSKARLRRQAAPLLRQAAPLWQAWTAAHDELGSVFAQFWHTGDGHWRAQLLRLTDAEQAARTAAEAWDAHAARLAQLVDEQIAVAGEWEELRLTTVAQEIGLDASDWHIAWHNAYTDRSPWYGDGGLLVDDLNHEIAAQRDRLTEVALLAGDTDPTAGEPA
ncbi:hypothetical protein [Streptomyces sp. NPDC004589]|uniref:hypothetical protein n=1 Tax=Streptomyces sp. NPDC004589 TaxID=3154553 RepID=UPI0033AFEDF4